MNITTKYNIGQKVWTTLIEGSKVKAKQVTIEHITINIAGSWDKGIQKETISVDYYFDIEGSRVCLAEENLFSTKENLAKSIIDQ